MNLKINLGDRHMASIGNLIAAQKTPHEETKRLFDGTQKLTHKAALCFILQIL